jgi:hypothetical protein
MDVSQWGPRAWFFLHSVTFYYPDKPTKKDKDNINTFFNSVGYILPCEHCRKHYQSHIKKFPIESNNNSKYDLTNWFIHVHNEVNKNTGKPTMTYSEVIKHYKQYYNSKSTNTRNYNYIYIGLLVVIVCIIILYNYLV